MTDPQEPSPSDADDVERHPLTAVRARDRPARYLIGATGRTLARTPSAAPLLPPHRGAEWLRKSTGATLLTTLNAILAGAPADVRAVYSARTLGPLIDGHSASQQMLPETLEVFLAHNGSWARTAEALHLHVNTVDYRVRRIVLLTGRDLSRLDHKLDLQAALLCR
ncbi:PucR family transcriptional regulator [Streptomyces sp. NBC_01224]|uniref:PucR family transcriptional regulator n=2 Tax=unclassified Streptomyces TaxID=2593676 RepID=UPI002E11AAB8